MSKINLNPNRFYSLEDIAEVIKNDGYCLTVEEYDCGKIETKMMIINDLDKLTDSIVNEFKSLGYTSENINNYNEYRKNNIIFAYYDNIKYTMIHKLYRLNQKEYQKLIKKLEELE